MNITLNSYLKYKPAWMQLVIFGGVTFVIGIVVSFIGVAIISQINHVSLLDISSLKQDDFAKPQYAGIVKGLLIVQSVGFFLLPPLVFAYFADPKPLEFAGLKKPGKIKFIFWGMIIMLCAYLMVGWLAALNQKLVQDFFGKTAQDWIEKAESDVNNTLQNILSMHSLKDLLMSILLVGVLAAVGEELFFRGILQRIFIQIFKSPWIGIIVAAAIFSAVHGQFLGFIPRLILGTILGALYWYSGSLWTAIAGHLIYNSVPIILVYYKVVDFTEQKSGKEASLNIMGIITLIIVIALLNYFRKKSSTTYEKVYESENRDGTDFS